SILGRSTVWGCPTYPRLEANCRHCRRVQRPKVPATARHPTRPIRAAVVTLCPRCRSGVWGSIYRAKGFGLVSGSTGRRVPQGPRQRLGLVAYTGACRQEMKIGVESFGRRHPVYAAGNGKSHEARYLDRSKRRRQESLKRAEASL